MPANGAPQRATPIPNHLASRPPPTSSATPREPATAPAPTAAVSTPTPASPDPSSSTDTTTEKTVRAPRVNVCNVVSPVSSVKWRSATIVRSPSTVWRSTRAAGTTPTLGGVS